MSHCILPLPQPPHHKFRNPLRLAVALSSATAPAVRIVPILVYPLWPYRTPSLHPPPALSCLISRDAVFIPPPIMQQDTIPQGPVIIPTLVSRTTPTLIVLPPSVTSLQTFVAPRRSHPLRHHHHPPNFLPLLQPPPQLLSIPLFLKHLRMITTSPFAVLLAPTRAYVPLQVVQARHVALPACSRANS